MSEPPMAAALCAVALMSAAAGHSLVRVRERAARCFRDGIVATDGLEASLEPPLQSEGDVASRQAREQRERRERERERYFFGPRQRRHECD